MIKRYEDEIYGPSSYDFEESESGSWVKYEDHAAEVARLNEQVRAQGADDFAAEMYRVANEHVASGRSKKDVIQCRAAAKAAEDYAAAIRAGEVPNV